jgi:hypothetical protein
MKYAFHYITKPDRIVADVVPSPLWCSGGDVAVCAHKSPHPTFVTTVVDVVSMHEHLERGHVVPEENGEEAGR